MLVAHSLVGVGVYIRFLARGGSLSAGDPDLKSGESMGITWSENKLSWKFPSLAWPDPFRAAAYRLEIISAALQGSGIVHVF